MLRNSQQNEENQFNPLIMMSMLFSVNADEIAQEREQHLAELRAFREAISPECTVTDEEREQHLADLAAVRESISPECTVSDEEREKHLAYVGYLNENVRGHLV